MKNLSIFKRNKLILLVLFILLIPFKLSAESISDQKIHINISFNKIKLQTVLEEIEKQSNYYFVYNHQNVNVAQKVSIVAKNQQLTDVLNNIFNPIGIAYNIVEKQIILKRKEKSENLGSVPVSTILNNTAEKHTGNSPGVSVEEKNSQKNLNKEIKGKITDKNNSPLTGVSIFTMDKKHGTFSNIDGSYSLAVNDTVNTLNFSNIGFKSIAKTLGKSSVLNVVMEEDVNLLSDIVITGYQNISKERATGSFAVLSSKQIQTRLETNIQDRFEGMIPGLFVNNGEVSIRGLSTINGNKTPLYVVDGFPYEGSILHINASDIVNITVLKDAAAASIYGARAANGVIVISTNSGKVSKLSINFNSSFFVTPLPDFDYLNLMNSSEAVDLQQELFNMGHYTNDYSRQRRAKPAVLQALYDHEAGLISETELNSKLNRLKTLDNRSQIEDLLLQNKFKHNYALTLNGGNEINKYYISGNFIGNRGYDIGGKTESINLNIKDQLRITKWLSADFGVSTSFDNSTYAPLGATSYFGMKMPYEMLKDENGNLTSWSHYKSETELERLRNLGLYDETYNPLSDMEHTSRTAKNTYLRLQGGFAVKFMEGLKLDLSYQTERENAYSKTVYDKESNDAKKEINDAAQLIDNTIIKNIPDGGQIFDTRGSSISYTMRAQMNFDKVFNKKHYVTALAGGERRSVANTSTATHHFGYNDSNLEYISINAKELASLKATQSINDSYSYNESAYNYYIETEDRYISFYSNAGYTYDGKYTLTGSARIDDSNLFGSDPKYRYLPMWSLGGSWNINKESFMSSVNWVNVLALRATYGINGNVVRKVGPFLQAEAIYNPDAQETGTRILFPPNKSLRWEKTAVTNVGIDFAILNHRLKGSVDYYNKYTTDLLGTKLLDPTNAFQSSLVNYGSMINRGVELSLNSINIRTKTFSWATLLNVSYNKNRMTEISAGSESLLSYTDGFACDRVGYPMGSLFNYRWAGLNPENGTPMVYNKDGEIIRNCDASGKPQYNVTDIEDIVFAGTIHPKYTIGFNNTFTWKNLSTTIVLIANGGNVMRDAVPMILTNGNYDQNTTKQASNFWRAPGDEKKEGIMPAPDILGNGVASYGTLWTAADINTVKADYVKVRSILLAYDVPVNIFGKEYFSGARLTFQVQNPFKWVANDRGLDPEAYYAASIYAKRTLPVTTTYIFGLNITF